MKDKKLPNEATNMYRYLLNLNRSNITKNDIEYIESLISAYTCADRANNVLRKCSKAVTFAAYATWGIGTLVTKGDATWTEAFRYVGNFSLGSWLGFSAIRARRVSDVLNKYNLTTSEYLSLQLKGKIEEFEDIIREYNIGLSRGVLITKDNEPFPEFAYTQSDKRKYSLLKLVAVAEEINRGLYRRGLRPGNIYFIPMDDFDEEDENRTENDNVENEDEARTENNNVKNDNDNNDDYDDTQEP